MASKLLASGFKHMAIYQTFLYLQEDKQYFLKVQPFFFNDTKNHRNRLNHSCRKT